MNEHVQTLIQKAAEATDSGDAMRFAQAALNAANALCSATTAESLKKNLDEAGAARPI